jgi:hypothetical protein
VTRLTAWIAFLVLAMIGLLTNPIPTVDGVSTAFAALRIVALGVGWYLAAITGVGLVARAFRIGTAVRVADVFTLPFVRHILNRAASVVVLASLAGPPMATVIVSPVVAVAASSPGADAPPIMHLLDDAPVATPPVPAAPGDRSYTVRPGDNFWAIASKLLGDPPDGDVVPAWHALIEANADQAPNPSLLFSGQVLRVPASVEPQSAPSPVSLPRTD